MWARRRQGAVLSVLDIYPGMPDSVAMTDSYEWLLIWLCEDCGAEHPAPLGSDGCPDCGSGRLVLATL